MLDDTNIVNIISNELNQASGGIENDIIEGQRQAALAAYLGQPNGKEVEGKSSIISTDVADAIEWILPEIVKAFTQNNEVVEFDPQFEGDEEQAELESKYVYDILMKDNNGFLIIHQFIKDALMQKNGFLKVFYEKKTIKSSEHYTGLTEIEYQAILSDPEIEISQQTVAEVEGIPIFDIKVDREKDRSKVNIICVPPEDFRVNRMHNSMCLKEARFTADVVEKTASDLIKEGYDRAIIDSLPSVSTVYDDTDYRFSDQGEITDSDHSIDPSQKKIEVSESYLEIDINEDGEAEFVKATIAGGDTGGTLLDWEEVDGNPYISATAIIMSHKLFGLSMYDRLKQIQEQKTALWRNIFDNLYLQNNQRTIVVENQVNLDDLLVSRPGGIIRAKRLDAVAPLQNPPLSADAYKMMDYLDVVRSGRSGVSPEGPVTDSMVGDRVGSEGVERMMSQKEELVGLMVRVFAEGIKELCLKIREEVIKHQDVARDYKFRGKWVNVMPQSWGDRENTTVRVGTGTGDKKAQMSALTSVMALQEKILANPQQSLVTEEKVYSAANDFIKLAGMPGAGRYLLDPTTPEGQENKKKVSESSAKAQEAEMKEKTMMMEAQAKIAEAEMQKAKAATENVQLKAQIDSVKNQLKGQEQMAEGQIKMLKQQLEEAKAIADTMGKGEDLKFKYYDANERHDIERERIRVQERQIEASKREGDTDG